MLSVVMLAGICSSLISALLSIIGLRRGVVLRGVVVIPWGWMITPRGWVVIPRGVVIWSYSWEGLIIHSLVAMYEH